MIDPQLIQQLHTAASYLAARCDGAGSEDGQGFSKFDTTLGKTAANTPTQLWSEAYARKVAKMLVKYSKQLENGDIALPALPAAETVAEGTVDVRGGVFVFTFPKQWVDVREAIKAGVDGRKFELEPFPHWTAPLSSGQAVGKLLEQFPQLEASPEAEAAVLAAPEPWRVEVEGKGAAVFFPYDAAVKDALKKAVPSARFQNDPARWLVGTADLGKLAKFTAAYPAFVVAPELGQLAEQVMANAAQSKAADAELVLDGFGLEPRPFQRAGIAYAVRNGRALIADEMGLGKTIQGLGALHALKAFPAVVVCPASLKLNWAREARRCLPGRTVTVVNSGQGNVPTADVVIINYDILAEGKDGKQVQLSHYTRDILAMRPVALIMDEAHYAKNQKAQRTAACEVIAKAVQYKFLLTGTPVMNRPNELPSLLKIMGVMDEMGGFWPFMRHFCGAHETRFGWDMSGAQNLGELNDRLRAVCMVRRTKAEVLKELPPKVYADVPMPLSNEADYRTAESDTVRWLGEQAAADADFLASIAHLPRLEQANAKSRRANSAAEKARRAEQLVRIGALKKLAGEGKIKGAVEWAKEFAESGQKLVIFAHHTAVVNALAKALKAPSITGATPLAKRQAAVDAFQNDPACMVIVGNLEAMGVGLTLTAASNVAFVEYGWTPALHAQAEDRCHRMGQIDSVTVWRLVAEKTIDNYMLAVLDSKAAVVNAVTDGVAGEEGEGVISELISKLLQSEE